MNRMMAIVEREMRKFFRSPALMLASMIFPLVQLIILGNAFGGKIHDAKVAIVDQDGGPQAVRVREAFDSVRANIRTFVPVPYDDEKQAVEDVRNGKLQGAVIIPPQFSRRVYEQNHPRIALVVDNSDNFMSSAVEAELSELTNALNQPTATPRILQQTALDIVELYPYIEYMKYLLPGSLVLAMFVSVMIGGGMLYIDDKARGRARRLSGHADHQARTGAGVEPGRRHQGGHDGRDHRGHRFDAGGRWHDLQSA